MDHTDYRSRIREVFQGEIYGEALFVSLAERFDDSDRRYKMRVLAQLETETKERVRPLLARLGCDQAEDDSARERGARHAAKLAAVPWQELMLRFRGEIAKYVASFEELQAAGAAEDAEILAHVTAHERALLAFRSRLNL